AVRAQRRQVDNSRTTKRVVSFGGEPRAVLLRIRVDDASQVPPAAITELEAERPAVLACLERDLLPEQASPWIENGHLPPGAADLHGQFANFLFEQVGV